MKRVFRGGSSYDDDVAWVRSAARDGYDDRSKDGYLGARWRR